MAGILVTIFFALVALYAAWNYSLAPQMGKKRVGAPGRIYIIIAVAAALLLRFVLSAVYKGHETDMNCFIAWSNAVFENGFGKFYTLDMFHDYPPGYMYVLYVIGAAQKLFSPVDGAQYLLVKLPALLCDAAAGVIIYKIAKNKFSDMSSALIASLYLFNPAAILNSALWGQVDAVYALLILLMIYFISEKKMTISYFMFALCILVKPQAFIFAPVLIGGIVENVFRDDFTRKKFLKNLGAGAAAIALVFLLALPFGIANVFEQYKATLASYPHMTVNAFNLWGALGMNWEDLTIPASVLSYILLAACAIYSFFIIIKSKDKSRFYVSGAVLAFFVYMLSVKMHDRYAFPSMVLMIAAFALTFNFHEYVMYGLISLSQFFNTAWVLFVYQTDMNKYYQSPVIVVASLINIALLIYAAQRSYRLYIENDLVSGKPLSGASKSKASASKKDKVEKKTVEIKNIIPKITRADIIAMIIITAVYSGIALRDLGDMHAPETEYTLSDAPVTLDLGNDYQINKIKYFLGSYELSANRNLSIRAKDSAGKNVYSETITDGDVFHWSEKAPNVSMRYVTLSTNGDKFSLKEIGFVSDDGTVITPVSASPDAAGTIFDEQDEVPDRSTFRNGTYFDEVYHARTAYEFVHGLSVYEWTHPPLGKLIIALGILLFGMCPFGWRIAGTVFGIIMVPIIYLFAKRLLKKTWLAVVTCILFTFDFMHFAQTRIATIDVYVTFFIMLMYYFMYKYYSSSLGTPLKKDLSYLAFSGIFMGFAVSSKWNGIYASLGLAVLFFITVYRRYKEYRAVLKDPSGETNGVSNGLIAYNFRSDMLKTFLWCVIFFVAVPLLIYGLSYIPYLNTPGQNGIGAIISNQKSMLAYHSHLDAEHSYSSRWYEWIIMKRPIWYYTGSVSDGVKEGISAFGNPLVWWVGIPAFMYMAYRIFKNKDKNSLFLIIAYLAQLVSWMGVSRVTFIYHYFPCVPFLTLMIGYSIYCIYEETKNKKNVMYAAFIYAALVIWLFVMFYPVLSGQPCNVDYVKNYLRWFNTWVLI